MFTVTRDGEVYLRSTSTREKAIAVATECFPGARIDHNDPHTIVWSWIDQNNCYCMAIHRA